MANVAAVHVCAAVPHLRRLSGGEMAAALVAISPAQRAECLRAAGLRPRPNVPIDRVARLLLARLRSLDGAAAHNVVVAITDPARAQLLLVVGDAEDRVVEDVARGLEGPLASWPRPVLATLFALLGELGAYPAATTDDLLELVAGDVTLGGHRPAGQDESTPRPPPEARSAQPSGFATAQPPPDRSALDAVLTGILFRAHGGTAGPGLDVAVLAVDELLSLDGQRPGSWRLRGLTNGLTAAPLERASRLPPTPEASYHQVVGYLDALVHQGRGEEVADHARSHRGEIDRMFGTSAECHLVEPVLTALLDRDPAAARRLLMLAVQPFPGWRDLVDGLRQTATHLATKDPVAAIGLLRAGDDMLTAWTPDLSHDDLDRVEQAAAELAVDRASCQRRAGDFRGARALLGRIDAAALSADARRRVLDEAALVAADVSSLQSLIFPETPADRQLVLVRLGRATSEIEAAVAGGSEMTGRVLRAVGSVAKGEQRQAVGDLRVACGALAEDSDPSTEDRCLLATLEFQLGLNELCLLEPGTDEAALRRIDRAIAAGHQPSAGELSMAAVALDAHGSSAATTMVGRALALSPGDADALELLGGLARRGVQGAAVVAAHSGRDDRLPRRVRFELLDGALSGAQSGSDGLDLEELADDLERLVANAADAELDQRWAARLATDDGLRFALGADTVEVVRLHALRRAGRNDDAVRVARGLYHRSLTGHVEGVDARDLLELLGQLGAGEEELRGLRRLLPSEMALTTTPTDATLDRPALVLFVGGNETQARAWPAVECAVSARYDGAVSVEWFPTGWGSNWAPAASEIESRYPLADVLVVMTFVRTMLGRRLRRTAGDAGLPWLACTGHGRASIDRAIDRAVAVARLRSASGA